MLRPVKKDDDTLLLKAFADIILPMKPFFLLPRLYLDKEVTLSEDVVHKYSDVALGRINSIIIELRRLFLVEDLVDSLKVSVHMQFFLSTQVFNKNQLVVKGVGFFLVV